MRYRHRILDAGGHGDGRAERALHEGRNDGGLVVDTVGDGDDARGNVMDWDQAEASVGEVRSNRPQGEHQRTPRSHDRHRLIRRGNYRPIGHVMVHRPARGGPEARPFLRGSPGNRQGIGGQLGDTHGGSVGERVVARYHDCTRHGEQRVDGDPRVGQGSAHERHVDGAVHVAGYEAISARRTRIAGSPSVGWTLVDTGGQWRSLWAGWLTTTGRWGWRAGQENRGGLLSRRG